MQTSRGRPWKTSIFPKFAILLLIVKNHDTLSVDLSSNFSVPFLYQVSHRIQRLLFILFLFLFLLITSLSLSLSLSPAPSCSLLLLHNAQRPTPNPQIHIMCQAISGGTANAPMSSPMMEAATGTNFRRCRLKAGCVPVRRRVVGPFIHWEVLLVESISKKKSWLFPKGSVDAGERVIDAATRETLEEGGVVGEVGPKLGSWMLSKQGLIKLQAMWLLLVHTEHAADCQVWLEADCRRRVWCSFSNARKLLRQSSSCCTSELLDMLLAAESAVATIQP